MIKFNFEINCGLFRSSFKMDVIIVLNICESLSLCVCVSVHAGQSWVCTVQIDVLLSSLIGLVSDCN